MFMPVMASWASPEHLLSMGFDDSDNCRAFFFAIIQRAVLDASGNIQIAGKEHYSGSTLGAMQRRAYLWIFSDRTKAHVTFRECCELLDVCPTTIRKRIKRLIELGRVSPIDISIKGLIGVCGRHDPHLQLVPVPKQGRK